MYKAHNTYYNFQNDMPEPITSNVVVPSDKPEKKPVAVKSKPATKTAFDQAVNNIKTGGTWRNVFDPTGDGTKWALIGAGAGLAYSLYKHKPWFMYTALAGIAGIAGHNIYKIIKPLKSTDDGK